MRIPIKRFDKSLPLPKYQDKAAGFDFLCRAGVTVQPGEMKAVPANIAVRLPKGYVLLVVPRSSTPAKFGLMMPHSIGVVDPFFSGNNDEIVLLVYNFTNEVVRLKKGDRVAQGVLVKYELAEFDEKAALPSSRFNGWKMPRRRKT